MTKPLLLCVLAFILACDSVVVVDPRENDGGLQDTSVDTNNDVSGDGVIPFVDAELRDGTVLDVASPDDGVVPIPDASVPDGNVPDAIVADAPCMVGTVIQSRAVAGGAGCTLGQKIQDLTCMAGNVYVWVDRGGFDGSQRVCNPGQTDPTGAACNGSSCVCSAGCAWEAVAAPTDCPNKRTVFVNFDGVVLSDCPNCSQPTANRSFLVGDPYGGSASQWSFIPFGRGRSSRDTILNNLSRYYSRFCIDFVDVRPSSGNYSMVIISDTILLPNHGVCALDCNDNGERVCIINKIADDSIDTISRYTAHELGHSYGLSHVSNQADIMQTISTGSNFGVSGVNEATCGFAIGQSQDGPQILGTRLGLRSEDGVGATCHVNGARGSCVNTASTTCGGTLFAGACPGGAAVVCCI